MLNRFEIPIGTRSLLLINILVWMGCCVSGKTGLVEIFGLHFFGAKNFFFFQLITYMFVHEAFTHLFFNMFPLYMFGGAIERVWGKKRFLIYYILTGIGAGLVQLIVSYAQIHYEVNRLGLGLNFQTLPSVYDFICNNFPITIGASGAIFGLLLAFGMLFPNAPICFIFIPIPIKAKYFVIGYGVIEFCFGISSHYSGDNIAHFAHLGGMLFGICMILYWKKKKLFHELLE